MQGTSIHPSYRCDDVPIAHAVLTPNDDGNSVVVLCKSHVVIVDANDIVKTIIYVEVRPVWVVEGEGCAGDGIPCPVNEVVGDVEIMLWVVSV